MPLNHNSHYSLEKQGVKSEFIVPQGATAGGWNNLPVGGGGWLVGIDMVASGARVVKADVYGAYYKAPTQYTNTICTFTQGSKSVTNIGIPLSSVFPYMQVTYTIDGVVTRGTVEYVDVKTGIMTLFTAYAGTSVVGASITFAQDTGWARLVTAKSMPACDLEINNGRGVYEIRISPKDSNIMYMMYNGYVYRTDTTGVFWARTNFPQCAPGDADANGWNRMYGKQMAIDPNNSKIVIVSTPGVSSTPGSGGVWMTTNSGKYWTYISALGVNPGHAGYTICYDVHSPVVNGATQGIYIIKDSVALYYSGDGGANWTVLPTGSSVPNSPVTPTFGHMVVNSTGTIYIAAYDGTHNLYSYSGGLYGTWTCMVTGTNDSAHYYVMDVAINPVNENQIVVADQAGYMSMSLDRGATWADYFSYYMQFIGGDVPWLVPISSPNVSFYLSLGGIVFDPTDQSGNSLWFANGIGVWKCNPVNQSVHNTGVGQIDHYGKTQYNWTCVTAGIDELVTTKILSVPNGPVLFSAWDRPIFVKDSYNINAPMYTYIESPNNIVCWDTDYAIGNNQFFAGIINRYVVWPTPTDFSGYTIDGGKTWNRFAYAATFTLSANPTSTLTSTVSATSNPAWTFPDGMYNTTLHNGTNLQATFTTSGGVTTVTWPYAVTDTNPNIYVITSGSLPAHVSDAYNCVAGCIAVSTPQNMLWFPAKSSGKNTGGLYSYGCPPYCTLDGGKTWIEMNYIDPAIPGIGNETGWGSEYPHRHIVCCADKVIPNKFYAYNYMTMCVYVTTDGGVTWTNIYNFGLKFNHNFKIKAHPYIANELYICVGQSSAETLATSTGTLFYHSTDGGYNWAVVPYVTDCFDFSWGAAKPGTTTLSIFILGYVNNNYGFWRSDDNCLTWNRIGIWPANSIDNFGIISGDLNIYGRCYTGASGSGWAYFDIPRAPSIIDASDLTLAPIGTFALGSQLTAPPVNILYNGIAQTSYQWYRSKGWVTADGTFLKDANNNNIWFTGATTFLTFTAPLSAATQGTLTIAWGGESGTYPLTLSTGTVVNAVFTKTSNIVTWDSAVYATTAASVMTIPYLIAIPGATDTVYTLTASDVIPNEVVFVRTTVTNEDSSLTHTSASVGVAMDNDLAAWLYRIQFAKPSAVTPTVSEQAAMSAFIQGIKQDNIWQNLDMLKFEATTDDFYKADVADASTSSDWNYASKTPNHIYGSGVQFDGTYFLSSYFNPAASPKCFNANNGFVAVYVKADTGTTNASYIGNNTGTILVGRNTPGTSVKHAINSPPLFSGVLNRSVGQFIIANRVNATTVNTYVNGVLAGADTVSMTFTTPLSGVSSGNFASIYNITTNTTTTTWPFPTGKYWIIFSNGQSLFGSFTSGSAYVNWLYNITSGVSSGHEVSTVSIDMVSSGTVAASNITLGGSSGLFCAALIGFSAIGGSLTDAQARSLSARFTTLYTALGAL